MVCAQRPKCLKSGQDSSLPLVELTRLDLKIANHAPYQLKQIVIQAIQALQHGMAKRIVEDGMGDRLLHDNRPRAILYFILLWVTLPLATQDGPGNR